MARQYTIGDLIAENNELIASVMDALPVAWRQSLKTCVCTGTVSFNLHDQTQLFPNAKRVLHAE